VYEPPLPVKPIQLSAAAFPVSVTKLFVSKACNVAKINWARADTVLKVLFPALPDTTVKNTVKLAK